VQVEIDRALYMDETTLELTAGYDSLRATLRGVMAEIADIGRATGASVAAE
jgi:N-formylglutamate deformylase